MDYVMIMKESEWKNYEMQIGWLYLYYKQAYIHPSTIQ